MRNVKYFLITLISLLLTACATDTVEIYNYQQNSRADDVYIKQGVDFTKYKAIQFRSISVWYPDGAFHPDENVAKANLARAEDLFKQTILQELDGKYRVLNKPARDAIWLHVEFVDLRSLSPGDPVPDEFKRKKFRTEAGHITLVAELRDSVTEDTLARAADLGRESAGGPGIIEWDVIEADFRKWAVMLREWMDSIHES